MGPAVEGAASNEEVEENEGCDAGEEEEEGERRHHDEGLEDGGEKPGGAAAEGFRRRGLAGGFHRTVEIGRSHRSDIDELGRHQERKSDGIGMVVKCGLYT